MVFSLRKERGKCEKLGWDFGHCLIAMTSKSFGTKTLPLNAVLASLV